VTSLVDKILAIDRSLDAGGVPHAFGGAIALAWCTQRARGTIDIDVNIFLGVDELDRALAGLPPEVGWKAGGPHLLERDGQARMWWDTTPVDVFLNTTEFHVAASGRCRRERFAGARLPFLSCPDLAVFKAFFNRDKDWVDLREMREAGTLEADVVAGVLTEYLGPDDDRLARLRSL
jgi:hypothetical protein